MSTSVVRLSQGHAGAVVEQGGDGVDDLENEINQIKVS